MDYLRAGVAKLRAPGKASLGATLGAKVGLQKGIYSRVKVTEMDAEVGSEAGMFTIDEDAGDLSMCVPLHP